MRRFPRIWSGILIRRTWTNPDATPRAQGGNLSAAMLLRFTAGAVPKSAASDAAHIAIATVHEGVS